MFKHVKRMVIYVICALVLLNFGTFAKEPVKAYRGIHLGETTGTVMEEVSSDGEIEFHRWLYQNKAPKDIQCIISISDVKYWLRFRFFEGKLYKVEIQSPQLGAEYFDSHVIGYQDTLVNIISTKYGQPTKWREFGLFDVYMLDTSEIGWTHIWESVDLGVPKKYKIGLSFNRAESTYYAVLHIEYLPLVEKKKKAEEEREKRTVTGAAEDF